MLRESPWEIKRGGKVSVRTSSGTSPALSLAEYLQKVGNFGSGNGGGGGNGGASSGHHRSASTLSNPGAAKGGKSSGGTTTKTTETTGTGTTTGESSWETYRPLLQSMSFPCVALTRCVVPCTTRASAPNYNGTLLRTFKVIRGERWCGLLFSGMSFWDRMAMYTNNCNWKCRMDNCKYKAWKLGLGLGLGGLQGSESGEKRRNPNSCFLTLTVRIPYHIPYHIPPTTHTHIRILTRI